MQHKAVYYYYASSLYMFWVSTTPIIRSTQNFNYSCFPRTWPSSQVDLCDSGWRQVRGTRPRDSKPSGFIKYGEFLD